ncbi:hypothetical protein KAJ27_12555, partial [bacterium]|nr:hypothetical protein [bacterium]
EKLFNLLNSKLYNLDHTALKSLNSGFENIDEYLNTIQGAPVSLPQGLSPVIKSVMLSESNDKLSVRRNYVLSRALLFTELLNSIQSNHDNSTNRFSNKNYYKWDDIKAIIDEIVHKYPNIISLHSLGKTLHGKDILLLKVSDNPTIDEDEPEILFTAGMHPREQQPQICLLELLKDLLEGYEHDTRITKLVNEREIWIVPVLNIDGKIHDFRRGTSSTLRNNWRKNRQKNPGNTRGVDINRNFPVRWVRTSLNGYKEDFPGQGPASEPETRALMNFISKHKLSMYIDLHSYMGANIVPRFITGSEADIYRTILYRIKDLQKKPYKFNEPHGFEVPSPSPWKGAGLGFVWSYYTQGIYSINMEVMGEGFYNTIDSVLIEYEDNVKEPLLYLIDMCKNLTISSEGSASLIDYSSNTPIIPGALITFETTIVGDFDYAVLVSHKASLRVLSEYRLHPEINGFTFKVMPSAVKGSSIPMSLFIWDKNRGRSVKNFYLEIE